MEEPQGETVLNYKFDNNFWGEENKGLDVLLHNMKVNVSASKELGDLVKEKVALEDSYVKSLWKLHKAVSHVSKPALGSFHPLWEVLVNMCEQQALVHAEFVSLLTQLSHEVSEYTNCLKEKHKAQTRGEIEGAQSNLQTLEQLHLSLQRSERQYQHSCDSLSKQYTRLERANKDPNVNVKIKQQIEAKINAADSANEQAKAEYKNLIKNYCAQTMEFQGKMAEACHKFEGMEEEHLAQMVTFMLKITQAYDNNCGCTQQVYKTVLSKLEELSVDQLMKFFVKESSTGTKKPVPPKFKYVPVGPNFNLGSRDDLGPQPKVRSHSDAKSDRTQKKILSKKILHAKKVLAVDQSTGGSVEGSDVSPNAPAVDEEGYSIRPEDAASISRFPGEESGSRRDSDSDSDFDDEHNRHFKIQIKSVPVDKPVASVDDIKASVMALRLEGGGGNLKKTTSTHSLDTGLNPSPGERRRPSTTSTNPMDSLLDLDLHQPSSSSSSSQKMPVPLLPFSSSSNSFTDPPIALVKNTSTQAPTLQPSRIAPPPPSSSSSSSSSRSHHPPPPHPQPPLPSQSAPVAPSHSPSLPSLPSSSSPSLPLSGSATSTASPRPVPRTRNIINNTFSSSLEHKKQQDAVDQVPLFPPPPQPTARTNRRAGEPSATTTTSEPIFRLTPPISRPRNTSRLQVDPHSPSLSPSMSPSGSSSSLSNAVAMTTALQPAVATTTTGTSGSANTTQQSPLATQQQQQQPQSQPQGSAIPIAVAIQETCSALFLHVQGPEGCKAKVAGEVVMSFPANSITQLASHEPLQFTLLRTEGVERLLHNQNLLLKEDPNSFSFKFNMDALSTHLQKMSERNVAPFYNIQILKYEVKAMGIDSMPVKLVCFWKCEPQTTNFRMDYTYNPSAFPAAQKAPPPPPPPLSNFTVSVPVSGSVTNSLARPSGTWVPEQEKMVWKVGSIAAPVEPGVLPAKTSLHAKFEVAEGPSTPAPAVVQFLCDGAVLSGMSVKLSTSAYRLSLLKFKCSAGQYTVQ